MKIKPNAIPAQARSVLYRSYQSYLPYTSYLQSAHSPPTISSKHSQSATLRGPLKSRGPLRFSFPSSLLPSCATASFSRCRGTVLDSEPKTKDAHMLTKKVSTFEKSERLSFLS